jgi:hypothetical protein
MLKAPSKTKLVNKMLYFLLLDITRVIVLLTKVLEGRRVDKNLRLM